MEKIKAIENILTNNCGDSWIRGVVEVVNSYSGALEGLEYRENDDDFFDTFFYGRPYEVAGAIFFGDYNYNDYYVRFDGYGNLVSVSEYDYAQELEDSKGEILEAMVDEWENIKENLDIDEEVRRAIDKIINEEEEEEE